MSNACVATNTNCWPRQLSTPTILANNNDNHNEPVAGPPSARRSLINERKLASFNSAPPPPPPERKSTSGDQVATATRPKVLSTFESHNQKSATKTSNNNNNTIASNKLERNSLESIQSQFSQSSATDTTQTTATTTTTTCGGGGSRNNSSGSNPTKSDPQQVDNVELSTFSCQTKLNLNEQQKHRQQLRRLPGAGGSSTNVALIATRYVSPPTIDDKQSCCWRDIPLNDDEGDNDAYCQRRTNSHKKEAKDFDIEPQNDSSSYSLSNHRHQANSANNKDSRSESFNNKQQLSAKQSKYRHNSTISNGSWSMKKSNKNNDPNDDDAASRPAGATHRGGRGANNVAPFPFAGILASILGSVFFSLSVLCVKFLPEDSDSGIVEKTKALLFRGICFMCLCGITMLVQGTTFLIRRDEIVINVMRSIFGVGGVYGLYLSLKFISLGDATALVFSSPIWTSILSHLLLKEPFHWIQILALPASMFGIVLIAHPALIIKMDHHGGDYERQPILMVPNDTQTMAPDGGGGGISGQPLLNSSIISNNLINITSLIAEQQQQHHQSHLIPIISDLDSATMSSESADFEHRWPGVVIALGTSFLVSLVYIVLKFRKSTPIQTTTFWLGATCALVSLIVMSFTGFGSWPASAGEWCVLFANGFASWCGQALIQWALMHEDASILSVVRTLDVAMTFSWSALFLEEEILWTSIVGATIIGLVVISIVMNSWIQATFMSPKAPSGHPDEFRPRVDDNDLVAVVDLATGQDSKQQMEIAQKSRRDTSDAA